MKKYSKNVITFGLALAIILVFLPTNNVTAQNMIPDYFSIPDVTINSVIEEENMWECVWFGHYFQTEDAEETSDVDVPLKWRIINQDEEKVLLCSDVTMNELGYFKPEDDLEEEEIAMKKWLNETFLYKAFTDEEIKAIVCVDEENIKQNDIEEEKGKAEKVFLLSGTEIDETENTDVHAALYLDLSSGAWSDAGTVGDAGTVNEKEPEITEETDSAMPDYDKTKSKSDDKLNTEKTFSKINAQKEEIDSIKFVCEKGIMSNAKNQIKNDEKMTRSMVIMTLYNLAGNPKVKNKNAFEKAGDVEAGQWYTDAVNWAYSNEITTGYTDRKMFGVYDNVTREQLAVFLYRYAEKKGYDVSDQKAIHALKNDEKVSGYAHEAVKWAYGTGVLPMKESDNNGKRIYDLAPSGSVTRGELAEVLERFCKCYSL